MDKAGKQYWDKIWGTYGIHKEANPDTEDCPVMLIVGFKSILAKYFRIQTPMKKLYWKLSVQGPCSCFMKNAC